MTITRKINMVKLIFLSIQHISHLPCKFDQFWFFLPMHAKLKRSFRYAVDANLFRLGSTNSKKKFGPFYFLIFKIQKPKTNLNFFVQKCSNLYKRCGMCWNKWKINFPIFIFRIMVIFVFKITPIFEEFSPRTRKIKFANKISFRFSFYSAHSVTLIKIWPLLMGGVGRGD